MSDSTTSASDRLSHSQVPYILLNGIIIAQNWDDFTSNPTGQNNLLHSPIYINELGQQTSNFSPVWTNSQFSGRIFKTTPKGTCRDWTSLITDGKVVVGETSQTTSKWTVAETDFDCTTPSSQARLYCFEQ